MDHLKLPVPNGLEFNRGKSLGKVFLKYHKSVITMVAKILFDCSPKELNKIEFTVKFWHKCAEVPCSLNNLLNQRLLLFEIWLKIQNLLCTTACGINWAIFAVHPKALFPQTLLHEDLLHTLGHVREVWMVGWEVHLLHDTLAILLK